MNIDTLRAASGRAPEVSPFPVPGHGVFDGRRPGSGQAEAAATADSGYLHTLFRQARPAPGLPPPQPHSWTPAPADRNETATRQTAARHEPTAGQPATPAPARNGGGPVSAQFEQQFAARAGDRAGFHQLMQQVYGEGYDRGRAEQLRRQALQGDFGWLPEVRYVDSHTLGGANGAYDQQAGVVYINEELRGSERAAQTFVEEAGHHLDTQLNRHDTAGDEGELLRRTLAGEQLSDAELNAIRSENDSGTITVDGRQIEVEFWNPFKALKNAAEAVVDGVKDVVKGVGNAIETVGEGIVDMTYGVGKGLVEGIGGFGEHLFRGEFGDAFDALGGGLAAAGGSLLDGIDNIALRAPQTLFNGALNGAQDIFNGVTELIPGGRYVREVTDRVFDGGRTLLQAGFGIARDVFRAPAELALDFGEDLTTSLGHLLRGEFGDAARRFGESFLNLGVGAGGRVVDVAVRALHGVADIVGMAVGQPPSRELTGDERAYLEQIYGDSLDYSQIRVRQGGITDLFGMAAHVVGNTIYMPKEDFDGDGALTADGLATLGHEAGHVWQNQNGGGDYIHKALFAQLGAMIDGGSRNGAYDWREAFGGGSAFEDMNPEQQASVAEDIGLALQDDGLVGPDDFSPPLSGAEYAFLMNAWAMIRAGQGAP